MTKILNENIEYCDSMLPKVSRTFAPTIRMLPVGLNTIVTVAYLLCRIADTVEDNEDISVAKKKELLNFYISIFKKDRDKPFEKFMNGIKALPENTYDEKLVYNLPKIINVYESFSPIFKKHSGLWIVEWSRGMHKYAQAAIRKKFSLSSVS